jgi:S-(hydroxymethyl)glutathione dehydrogenase/alcohol dehydrogenase
VYNLTCPKANKAKKEAIVKAAVLHEFGKPVVIEEINIDPPGKEEVKVRLAATAVCHSDIHVLKGELGGEPPLVAGHESAGYIEEVGEGVTSVKVGDPVVLSLIDHCGHCLYCRTGLPHLCDTPLPLRTGTRLSNKKGKPIGQVLRTGSFAEFAVVHNSQVVKIPKDMPMDRAALLGCGVITGFGAVVNTANLHSLQSAVVIGAGGVGLNSIQGAAFSGAYPVIAVDVLPNKLKAAKQFGATHTVNAKNVDAIEAVKKLTDGKGADHVFVTVGSARAIEQGVAMSGRRGTTVIVGLPKITDSISFSAFAFLDGERRLTGSFMGSTNLQVDVPKLVTLYKAGKLKLDELITAHYPLGKINTAIDKVLKGQALRNVIMFD